MGAVEMEFPARARRLKNNSNLVVVLLVKGWSQAPARYINTIQDLELPTERGYWDHYRRGFFGPDMAALKWPVFVLGVVGFGFILDRGCMGRVGVF